MDERTNEYNDILEVDIRRLLVAVRKKIWLLVVASISGALLAMFVTYYFIVPKYQSSAMFYVNNSSISVGDASLSISSADIVASKSLVESYIVILKARTTLTDIIDYADVNRTYMEMKDMISAAPVNSTEIFEVVVTSTDPAEAEKVANAIAYILPKRISSIIEGSSAKIVDTAIMASRPSSPSYIKNIILGFLLALILSVGVIVIKELFSIKVKTEDDIARICKYPILSSVPDMTSSSGSGYQYGYGSSRKNVPQILSSSKEQRVLYGKRISFAASEAYKLLRTKLQFSFTDEGKCRVVGLSSALSGEGKSLSSINLSYSLSQLDKKVILIDCDMRKPTLAEKLDIKKSPGLSNWLTGQSQLQDLMQKCNIKEEEDAFCVISAGQNPPNPIELLSSERMTQLISQLREEYDYVILDLPPVEEVSDALAIAKEIDGILLVVRQNYCNRMALSNTVRQFEFIGSKVLGVVYNCIGEDGTGYGKKYYKSYYRKYDQSNTKNDAEKHEQSQKRSVKSKK